MDLEFAIFSILNAFSKQTIANANLPLTDINLNEIVTVDPNLWTWGSGMNKIKSMIQFNGSLYAFGGGDGKIFKSIDESPDNGR